MAKRKKKRSANSGRVITTPSSLTPRYVVPLRATPLKTPRSAILNTDRRRYNPTKTIAPLGASKRDATKIVIRNKLKTSVNLIGHAVSKKRQMQLMLGNPLKYARRQAGYSTVSERLAFNVPKRIEMCIRRAVRGRVLHAKKKTGKSGQKRPVRNFWSNISC